jgi:hypothetical protein
MSLGSDLAPNASVEARGAAREQDSNARQDETSPALEADANKEADADEETVRRADQPADLCTAHELLGSYALVSQLAAGHLTTLHRARVAGAEGDATLVVKRLQYGHVNEQADRELLLAAGRAAMRVRSPNFVRVLSVHEDPEPFVVMEHVPGVTLSTLLAEIEDGEVLRYVLPILVDVLEGLEVLHGLRDASFGSRAESRASTGTAASLVHGAPCARHVLIGTDGVARLFDLTHAIGPGFSVAARRSLRLSPSEMAPEQVLAPMHVDARCDLFIMGTVLWRALTGQPLFEHAQREEALSQLLRKPILAPSAAGSPAGKRFDRICLRALARARAERYGSAAELARELKAEAERASLYATRDEIANLVCTLAAANHEADSETAVLLTPHEGSAVREQPPEAKPAARFCSHADPRASTEAAEAPDVLTLHHQGSTRFGFAGAQAAPVAAVPREAAAGVAEADAREARPAGRESGTWYEGLPSIFPSRDQPRATAPFWLWGIAAAAALLGSVLIDNPPWQTSGRARVTPQRASYRSRAPVDETAGLAGAAGYTAFFDDTQRSSASSALPPRAKADPPACAPSEQRAASAELSRNASAELTQAAQKTAPALTTARVKAKRFLSPLPPNPY